MDVLGASYGGYLDDKAANLRNQRNDVYNEFVQGWNYGQEAKQARAGAYNAKMAGRRAMLGTILGGAQQYYDLRSSIGAANTSKPADAPTVRLGDSITNGNYTIYKLGDKFHINNKHMPWIKNTWR